MDGMVDCLVGMCGPPKAALDWAPRFPHLVAAPGAVPDNVVPVSDFVAADRAGQIVHIL